MDVGAVDQAGSKLEQKTVLLVDDDESLLMHLEIGLSAYAGLRVVTAVDGQDAVEKLETENADVVVTDVQMPRMDGLALVAHLSRHRPKLPMIVITGRSSPAVEHKLRRLGIVSYVKKPVETDALAEQIFDMLVGVDSGYVHGIAVASFLQLLHADRKTCCLRITMDDRIGYLHFVNGDIWDASLGEERGLPAAMEIVSWEETLTIDIQNIVRLKERTIEMDVTFLVMDALRRKDEGAGPPTEDIKIRNSLFAFPERSSLPAPPDAAVRGVCENPGMTDFSELSSRQKFQLYECLERIRDVNGYRASAILTASGEPLATHSAQPDIDIEQLSRLFNDMFASIGERSRAYGLTPWEETGFRSSGGIVVFRCTADASRAHLHAVALVDDQAAEGILRIRLKRALDEAADLLVNSNVARRHTVQTR